MAEPEFKYYERLILTRIRKLLSHVEGHAKGMLDVESGKEYICSVCDLPLKPCLVHEGSLCCLALKGGTELLELEAALKRVRDREYGTCSLCGKKISKQYLTTHPTAVYCNPCRDDVSRQRRSKK